MKFIVAGLTAVLIALLVWGLAFRGWFPQTVVVTVTPSVASTSEVRDTVPPVSSPGTGVVYAAESSGICRLDKIATWSEQAGGPYRIEAGGGGVEHIDFYPARGVRAVSYIVPIREPEIWMGFGSAWEGNGPECVSFDYVRDATDYARGRLNNGHSGIVVDLRGGSAQVVANVANLSDSEVKNLLAVHRQAMNAATSVEPAATPIPSSSASTPVPPSAPTPVPVVCPEGVREDHPPTVGSTWTPAGEWRIVNFWTNEPGKDQTERKLLLAPTDRPALRGGGSSWSWPASCGSVAQTEFAKNSLPSVTLAQLQAEGLVR